MCTVVDAGARARGLRDGGGIDVALTRRMANGSWQAAAGAGAEAVPVVLGPGLDAAASETFRVAAAEVEARAEAMLLNGLHGKCC